MKGLAREKDHSTRTISAVMVITLAGKVLGLFRDHLMAVHYGTAGMEAKAFYHRQPDPQGFFRRGVRLGHCRLLHPGVQ